MQNGIYVCTGKCRCPSTARPPWYARVGDGSSTYTKRRRQKSAARNAKYPTTVQRKRTLILFILYSAYLLAKQCLLEAAITLNGEPKTYLRAL